MKKFYNLIILACAMLFFACSSPKPLTYFTDIDTFETTPTGNYNVPIAPADELIITVTSETPIASAPYNLPLFNPASSTELTKSTTPRQQTYIVDSQGDIYFPILGKIHVAGMTVEQLHKLLVEKIGEDVPDPNVRVELVNFYVNVAGEVSRPGRVSVNTPRFSILDALTAVGDMTAYGQRTNVLVIREENGVRTHARLDLTKAETLQSPYFYLRQNDYVYVEPDRIRKENAKYSQNNSFKLSLASTIVSASSVLISLIIALTR